MLWLHGRAAPLRGVNVRVYHRDLVAEADDIAQRFSIDS